MSPPAKKKAKWRNATMIGSKDLENMELHKVCGYCEEVFDGDENPQTLQDHYNNHYQLDNVTICQNCHVCVKKDEKTDHIQQFHKAHPKQVKFEMNMSLIELRIILEPSEISENPQKSPIFSNFWGILTENANTNAHFRSFLQRNREKYKSMRSLCAFRIFDEKLWWQCGICADSKPVVFNETIGMRAFALKHLEFQHLQEVDLYSPGFFESEWNHLQNETDFDVEMLIQISRHRLKWKKRSVNTFYTVDLSKLENPKNGLNFERILRRKSGIRDEIPVRFCFVCCSLVENSKKVLGRHFQQRIHEDLEATFHSTIFTEIRGEPVVKMEIKEEIEDGINENTPSNSNEYFDFPREFFNYSKSFKDHRRDSVTWKCRLCPNSPPISAATWILMRMCALRHIDDQHAFLFTAEFLDFEWKSIQQDIGASFDIRNFTPLQYTLRGENTFNSNDPNDYVLPQQVYFLPEKWREDTVVCGFCYCTVSRHEFTTHIVIHGFPKEKSFVAIVAPDRNDKRVPPLMGQFEEFNSLQNETHKILTIEGKRIQTKMSLMAASVGEERDVSYCPSTGCSRTPAEFTPRSKRKSAHDARQLLADTFQILKDTTRNLGRRSSDAQCSSPSSSSDDENSEDEKMEESLMTKEELRQKEREKTKSPTKKRDLDKMRPAEIREWIRKEAVKRGVKWRDSDSSSSESENSENEEKSSGWDAMKPEAIKKLIKNAAKKQNVQIQEDSSDDDD